MVHRDRRQRDRPHHHGRRGQHLWGPQRPPPSRTIAAGRTARCGSPRSAPIRSAASRPAGRSANSPSQPRATAVRYHGRTRRRAVVHRIQRDQIGRITTSGAITEFTIPTAKSAIPPSSPAAPTARCGSPRPAPIRSAALRRAAPSPSSPSDAGVEPQGITAGPDGALWITGRINGISHRAHDRRRLQHGDRADRRIPADLRHDGAERQSLVHRVQRQSGRRAGALDERVIALRQPGLRGLCRRRGALFHATFSRAVTVTGTPTLSLNDGGVASYDAAQSTSTALVFDYTVGAGQNTAALAATRSTCRRRDNHRRQRQQCQPGECRRPFTGRRDRHHGADGRAQ